MNGHRLQFSTMWGSHAETFFLFFFWLNGEEIVGFQSRRIVGFQWREIFEKKGSKWSIT